MTRSIALVELAMKAQSLTQKALALRLGVSQTQISKWKNGEHMSRDMEERLTELAGIGEVHPELVQWTGSLADAEKWDRLISYLAEDAKWGNESGYDTYPLEDDLGRLCWHTLDTLRQMGVTIPQPFPVELDFDYDQMLDGEVPDDVSEQLVEKLYSHPIVPLIKEIFAALTDVWGFYAAYVYDLTYGEHSAELHEETDAANIDACMIELAAAKLKKVDRSLAPDFDKFRFETERQYRKWLNKLKVKAIQKGIPLKVELLDLVGDTAGELGEAAERESFGLTAYRMHPDIYMNQLLTGMHIIHQVLPKILEKLDIKFRLDEDAYHVGQPPHTRTPIDDDDDAAESGHEPMQEEPVQEMKETGAPANDDEPESLDYNMRHMPPERRAKAERALALVRERFVKRFGREPMKGEPVFFDEDASGDTPVALTDEKMRVEMIRAMLTASTPLHLIYAWDKTGLILDEQGYQFAHPNARADWDRARAEFFAMNRKQRRTWEHEVRKFVGTDEKDMARPAPKKIGIYDALDAQNTRKPKPKPKA